MTDHDSNDSSLQPDPLDVSRLDRALDGGFEAVREEAAENDPNPSVLKQIGARIGSKPSVSLRDVDPTGDTPMLEPLMGKSDRPRDSARYKVLGILGQGGVGAVHRGHDTDLGRDIAMKFLHERYAKEPSVLHRFVEEAQIGGQLQHPGIVPVYELGMADGKPFFTMKMVKGETLAKKLTERANIGAERRSFLVIFEDICQTMAYAHARGVVHRDLKPANIMIGSFGEVQVVDWGMGKVMSDSGASAPLSEAERESQISVIETARSSGRGTQSILGSVMGTPAYMPPEQARGDVDAMDERSDVFALGAVLCEILTGQPPYVGDQREMLSMAALAKLDDAYARLESCGAEKQLVELAKLCLMAAPAARPRSAGEVAEKIHKYLGAAEERAHEATVRAMSLKRAVKLGLAMAVVIAVAMGASIWFGGEAADAREVAEEQRGLADDLRSEADLSRQAAEASKKVAVAQAFAAQEADEATRDYLEKFDLLSYVRRFEAQTKAPRPFYPARLDKVPAMRRWLADAEVLRNALPELRKALVALQGRATPQSEADKANNPKTHARAAGLAVSEQRLRGQLAAQDVRSGRASVAAVELTSGTDNLDRMMELAKALAGEARQVFGREAEGLACARRAVELSARKLGAAQLPSVRSAAGIALAWALFACGLDDEAIQQHVAVLADAGEGKSPLSVDSLVRLRRAVSHANSSAAATEIEELKAHVKALRVEVQTRWHWEFAKKEDEYLHDALRDLIAGIERFEVTDVAAVRAQLRWAEQVEEVTVTRHRQAWDEAALAIADANGTSASKLYAADPFLLKPQAGLVPIGMNPVSKLWEFYHLRSAWDGRLDPLKIEIPKHQADGSIAMTGKTGIVFVLLPGATYTMGVQNQDPKGANYYAEATDNEAGSEQVREVTLEPFFLARYEVTQGQWARLWNGDERDRNPAYYHRGEVWNGHVVSLVNPVEMVSLPMCEATAVQYGFDLPTEEQWEYGCRGGTSSPWVCHQNQLGAFANVSDATAARYKNPWGVFEEWDDEHMLHAPVGSFTANAFGLHNMLGNVHEWTSSPFRGVPGRELFVIRGGSFRRDSAFARSSIRHPALAGQRDFAIGVRFSIPLAQQK